jgi:hypothetical protein
MSPGSPTSADLLEEARKARIHAARARRMASGLTQPSDRLRLERYAEELEERAAELERLALSPASSPIPSLVTQPPVTAPPVTPPPVTPPLVTQTQEQVQQQQQSEPPPRPEK